MGFAIVLFAAILLTMVLIMISTAVKSSENIRAVLYSILTGLIIFLFVIGW